MAAILVLWIIDIARDDIAIPFWVYLTLAVSQFVFSLAIEA